MSASSEITPAQSYVRLSVLANELGFSTKSISRSVQSRGFTPKRLKDASNAPLVLAADEADNFREVVRRERNLLATHAKNCEVVAGVGGVYVIEVPSFSGFTRLKVGWTTDFSARLTSYRTIVPDLRVWGLWITSDSDMERFALRLFEQRARPVFTELFEVDDPNALTERLDELFNELGVRRSRGTPDP